MPLRGGNVRDKMLLHRRDTVSNAAMATENEPAYDFYVKSQKVQKVSSFSQK